MASGHGSSDGPAPQMPEPKLVPPKPAYMGPKNRYLSAYYFNDKVIVNGVIIQEQ